MLQRILHSAYKVVWFVTLAAQPAFASLDRFDSGLLARFEASAPSERLDEGEAVRRFVDEHYGSQDPAFEWREARVDRDDTHAHAVFQLHYEGRRVANHVLKVHYNRDGWVQYASSSWKFPFRVEVPAPSRARKDEREAQLRREIFRSRGIRDLKLHSDPVIWVSERGEAHAALEVVVSAFSRGYIRRLFIDERSGRHLGDMPGTRSIDVPNQQVYLKDPLPFPGNGTLTTVTLTGLESTDTLASSHIHVYRHEDEADPRVVEISSSTIFKNVSGWDPDPQSFTSSCGTSSDKNDPTKCANQGFDGTNVYYHLQTFRDRLDEMFADIGSTPEVLRNDPLPVLVNAFFDSDGSGSTDRNNALYIPSGCPDGLGADACIIFVPPASGSLSDCGVGSKVFFDPAREGVVLVHEYQHYVTDMISGMVGTLVATEVHVADALHEGYSDYFGASQVTRVAGTNATLVGEYFLKNCTPLQREIATIQPFENSEADIDPHHSGQSWASGLWAMREFLGADAADLIALKSLYFMPIMPTSFDSVEALVKADASLNGGVNAGFIRSLFYNQVKWVAGASTIFDPTTKLIDVGFSGCVSVARPGKALPTLLGLVVWLGATIAAGRRRRRRE